MHYVKLLSGDIRPLLLQSILHKVPDYQDPDYVNRVSIQCKNDDDQDWDITYKDGIYMLTWYQHTIPSPTLGHSYSSILDSRAEPIDITRYLPLDRKYAVTVVHGPNFILRV